jgi:glutaredoxin
MKVVYIFLVTFLLVLSGCGNIGSPYSQEDIDSFATCLTAAGVTMYGTFWCPHCAKTKKKFGTSFKLINYVECDARGDNEQSELCMEKGIEKYDTWEFLDGSRVVGEPTFEDLASRSGCIAPEVKDGS